MSCCKTFINYYKYNKTIKLPWKGCRLIEWILKIELYATIIGVSIYLNGHQASYGLSSSVVIKLHGIGISNNDRRIIWDTVDSVVPPQEEDGLFITTNFILTYNQTQGVCPENLDVKNSECKIDADCQKDRILLKGNGVMTGKCVQATPNNKTCEIKSWCPLENFMTEHLSNNTIKDIQNFTILIKNAIIFDKVNVSRSNMDDDIVEEISDDCIYNGSDKLLKYCPIFKVSSIIESFQKKNITNLLIYGGIARIIIQWECNLDNGGNSCKPVYTFSELFPLLNKFNNGLNFRYANYYEKDMKEYRTLFKVYGLRILVEVRGNGRRTEFVTVAILMGSIFSYLVIVEICIQFILDKTFEEDIYENVQNKMGGCERFNQMLRNNYECLKQKIMGRWQLCKQRCCSECCLKQTMNQCTPDGRSMDNIENYNIELLKE